MVTPSRWIIAENNVNRTFSSVQTPRPFQDHQAGGGVDVAM
jgi:hypothetical protein